MADIDIQLDLIKLIKEVNKQGIKNFELEYGDLKLKIKDEAPAMKAEEVIEKIHEIPEASSNQVEEMEAMEQKTITERLQERDEALLYELDFIAPEVAGDLKRNNIIRVGADGCYEYVDGEELHA